MTSFGPFQVLKVQKLQPQLHFAFSGMIAEPKLSRNMIMKQTIPPAMLYLFPRMSLSCHYVESIPSHAADILTFNGLKCDKPRLQRVYRSKNLLLLERNGPNHFSLH